MSEQTQENFAPSSLDSIFASAVEVEDTPAEPEQTSTEAPQEGAESEDKTGEKEKPSESSPDAEQEPKAEKDNSHSVPLAAMLEEREKRKALQAELEQLKTQQEPPKKPSVFDDEDAYRRDIEQNIEGQVLQRTLAMSEHLAVQEHGQEQVQSAIDKLSGYVKQDPNLAVRFKNAASPFHEAIKIVSEQEKVQAALGGEYESEIERLKREIEELKAKDAEEGDIPKSLASVSGTGVGAGSEWQGPTPLTEALK